MQIASIGNFFSIIKIYYGFVGPFRFVTAFVLSLFNSIFESIGFILLIPFANLLLSGKETLSSLGIFNQLSFVFGEAFSINENLLVVFLVSLFLLKIIIVFFSNFYTSYFTAKLISEVSGKFLKLFGEMRYVKFASYNSTFLQNLLLSDLKIFSGAFTYLLNFLFFGVNFLILTWLSIVIGSQLLLYFIFPGIALVIFYIIISKVLKRNSYELAKENDQYLDKIKEFITGFRYFKATSQFSKLFRKVSASLISIQNTRVRSGIADSLTKSIPESFIAICFVLILFYHVRVLNSNIPILLVNIGLLLRVLQSGISCFGNWVGLMNFNQSIQRINGGFFELEMNKEFVNPTGLNVGSFKRVKFDNVSFSTDDNIIFEGLSFEINKGEKIGIIGQSGSGKTTFINLILGLLEPSGGKLFFNDLEYKNCNLDSIRSLCGLIEQKSIFFKDTLINNVSVWDEKISTEEVVHLLEKVNISVNQKSLLEIEKSEHHFSGGELQRISLIRELIRKCSLLILDEPTSSLDSHTEEKVIETINEVLKEETVIHITHKPYLLKNYDKILHFENARCKVYSNFSEWETRN
ncbi:ABC transporter ATP-binding protein [Leptospira yanagawae]|uniref:ABC transporter ATP-binding protein n=1 Tax=Leptospira yanagawae TaxID=293069 RepID=A0ABY2LWS8_9LEPT|nr:ABC transporter ATP-binding protein [Leptospira yanagawae]TGL16965.1 ABC transporter ATP-binding protein [Leptospira yanagawae]